MFYKILDEYIEKYKIDETSAFDDMQNHYDCEDEYWAIIRELLDRYINLQSKIDKARKIIDRYSRVVDYDDEVSIDVLYEIDDVLKEAENVKNN